MDQNPDEKAVMPSSMADYAVRRATLDDPEALTDIYNHYVVNTAITFDVRVFTASERRGWFDEHGDSGPHRLLVATDASNRCRGYASSSRWRPKRAYNTTVETRFTVTRRLLGGAAARRSIRRCSLCSKARTFTGSLQA
jgi:phosphinothricin acetyltransferase